MRGEVSCKEAERRVVKLESNRHTAFISQRVRNSGRHGVSLPN